MMAMSQKAGAMAAQVRKGTIHAVLCQNLVECNAERFPGIGCTFSRHATVPLVRANSWMCGFLGSHDLSWAF